MYNNSVHTSQRTQYVSTTQKNRLTLFKNMSIIAVDLRNVQNKYIVASSIRLMFTQVVHVITAVLHMVKCLYKESGSESFKYKRIHG
jgi:hypothetical protein